MASPYIKQIKKDNRPYIESLKADLEARKDPDFFWPTGTQVYCGRQGSGKTVSAIKHLLDLKIRYPKAIIVSNVNLTYYNPVVVKNKTELKEFSGKFRTHKDYLFFQSIEQLSFLLVSVNNGRYGVIYVVDEIHTYFNALDSKNIPMYVFTEISQQRKQRKLIIGTSQLFMRLAKPFREQCDNIIICNTIAGFFTTQRAYDGMTIEQDYDGKLNGDLKKTGWFFHNNHIRKAFDTYQKVQSGSEQYENTQRIEITSKKPGIFGKK